MSNNNIAYAFSYISVVIIMIMYFIIVKNYLNSESIEKFSLTSSSVNYDNLFKYRASNTRIMYNNTGELPWNRHLINSSIPYDIEIKTEAENVYVTHGREDAIVHWCKQNKIQGLALSLSGRDDENEL